MKYLKTIKSKVSFIVCLILGQLLSLVEKIRGSEQPDKEILCSILQRLQIKHKKDRFGEPYETMHEKVKTFNKIIEQVS